jgi:hypothetical protein
MSNRSMLSIAVSCLFVGVFAGVAGGEALEAVNRQYLNTGLFPVKTNQTAYFRVSLDDVPGAPPTRVVLQLFDSGGVVVARKETTLLPGQSATLQRSGAGLFRAHADVIDPDLPLSPRRTTVSTVEVVDTITGGSHFVCSDPGGLPPGRY